MKTFLAWIGGAVLLLFFLGAIGAGNFLIKFSSKPIVCIEAP